MPCPRCAGLVVPELLCEGRTRVMAHRCIHCGDLSDRVIVLNRQHNPLPSPSRSRTPIYRSDRWNKHTSMFA